MKKKIEKLNINLFPDTKVNETEYKRAKAYFINKYPPRVEYGKYIPGGFFSTGYYEKDREIPQPEVAEAKWNEYYPNGYETWKNQQRKLNAYGEQMVINKINEIIENL